MLSPRAEVTEERKLKVWLDWPSRLLFESPVMTEEELKCVYIATKNFYRVIFEVIYD